MNKKLADVLAIALAARSLDVEPKCLLHFSGAKPNADEVADFIKQLSLRLQSDIDESVASEDLSFLIKN